MATLTKERVKIVELKQPRCVHTYSEGQTNPPGAADIEYLTGETVDAGLFNREASHEIVVRCTLPASSPNGCIFELGGESVGAYIGFTDGKLVWRVGDGSVSDYANNNAMIRREVPSAAYGEDVKIVARVIMPDRITLGVYDTGSSRCYMYAEGYSPNGALRNNTWAGANNGGIGDNVSAYPVGESDAAFNGTITYARFWEGVFEQTGCHAPYSEPCYNVWGTCQAKANYDGSGSFTWRFSEPGTNYQVNADYSDPDNPKSSLIPCLAGCSARSTKINIGSVREGQKPLGIAGGASANFADIPFDDYQGDPYKGDRVTPIDATYWALFAARTPFYRNIEVTIAEGLTSDSYLSLSRRTYIMESLDGPDNKGNVNLKAIDPLRTLNASESEFPRATIMTLSQDIDENVESLTIEASDEADLSEAFGNSATKAVVIGSEIITYTGYSGADGVWELTGVQRGQYNTEVSSHSKDDAVQRAGIIEDMEAWEAAKYLLDQVDSPVKDYVNAAEWEAEYNEYIAGTLLDRVIPKPTGIYDLLGEIMRDAGMFIWWDDLSAKVPLKVIRPEEASTRFVYETDMVFGSFSLMRESTEQFSQLRLLYDPIDPTQGTGDDNMRKRLRLINAEVENENSGGASQTKEIRSLWIKRESMAAQLANRLIGRYQNVPKYCSFVTLRDDVNLGDVVEISSPKLLTINGAREIKRWQVISREDVNGGEAYKLLCQEFDFQSVRYGNWMADDAPDYTAASGQEKESGLWWADINGNMSDGSEGYKWR